MRQGYGSNAMGHLLHEPLDVQALEYRAIAA
jgi:hypothetical protein